MNAIFNHIPDIRDTYTRKVRVDRCVDGDTVDLVKDMGERVWKTDRYRLLGINTPERGEVGFNEATRYLEQLILDHADEEGFIFCRTEKHGKFRWLAVLFGADGTNLNRLMVEAGHAVEYMV